MPLVEFPVGLSSRNQRVKSWFPNFVGKICTDFLWIQVWSFFPSILLLSSYGFKEKHKSLLLCIHIPVRIIPPKSCANRSAVREEPIPTCVSVFTQRILLCYILVYTVKSGICLFHRTLALLVAKDITKHKMFQAVLFLLPSGSHFSADNLLFILHMIFQQSLHVSQYSEHYP